MSDDIVGLLAEEAAAAESSAEQETPYVRNRTRTKEPAQVYSLRIPVDHLEDVRRLAESRSVPPTVLMRQWVLERLDVELARGTDLELKRADVLADRIDEPVVAMTQTELIGAIDRALQERGFELPVSPQHGGRHARQDGRQ